MRHPNHRSVLKVRSTVRMTDGWLVRAIVFLFQCRCRTQQENMSIDRKLSTPLQITRKTPWRRQITRALTFLLFNNSKHLLTSQSSLFAYSSFSEAASHDHWININKRKGIQVLTQYNIAESDCIRLRTKTNRLRQQSCEK